MSDDYSTDPNELTTNDKKVMAYLACGNSAYDLLCEHIKVLKQVGKFDELLQDAEDANKEIELDHDFVFGELLNLADVTLIR